MPGATKQNRRRRNQRQRIQPPPSRPRAPLTRAAKKSLAVQRKRVTSATGVTTQQFQALMNSLTLPHDTAPVRYPIAGFVKKTAAKKLYAEFNFMASPQGPLYWPILLARSPVHPVWVTQQVGAQQLIHQWVMLVQQDGLIPTLEVSQVKFGVYYSMPGVLDTFHPNAACRYLIYVPAGAVFRVQVGNANADAHEMKIHLVGLTSLGGGSSEYAFDMTVPLSSSSGSLEVTTTISSWVKVDRLATADSNGAAINTTYGTELVISVNAQPTEALYPLLPAFPPIAQQATVTLMGETRLTASSLLMTNTTPNLFKGGRVDAAYLDYEQMNVFDAPTLPSAMLTRQADLRYMGKAELGMYMYTSPTEKSQALVSYYCPDAIGIDPEGQSIPPAVLICRLEDFQLPTAGLYQQTSVSTPEGQQFSCFYDEHLEAVTTEQVWDTETAPQWLTPDLYQKMLTALANLPPACENPGHWSKLKKFVKSAFLFAKPEISSVVGRMAALALGG